MQPRAAVSGGIQARWARPSAHVFGERAAGPTPTDHGPWSMDHGARIIDHGQSGRLMSRVCGWLWGEGSTATRLWAISPTATLLWDVVAVAMEPQPPRPCGCGWLLTAVGCGGGCETLKICVKGRAPQPCGCGGCDGCDGCGLTATTAMLHSHVAVGNISHSHPRPPTARHSHATAMPQPHGCGGCDED